MERNISQSETNHIIKTEESFSMGEILREKAVMCKCGRQAIERTFTAMGQEMTMVFCECQNRARHVEPESIEKSDLPPRLICETMSDWKPGNDIAIEWLRRYEPRSFRGALFVGPYGTGKTKVAAEAYKRAHTCGLRCRYLNNGNLKWGLQRYQGDGQELSRWTDQYRKAGWMLWDDLGQTAMTESQSAFYYQVINFRYDHMLPTIYTTHMNSDELTRVIGGECVSRILGCCDVVKFSGKDYRG